jgi:hypothetical protein
MFPEPEVIAKSSRLKERVGDVEREAPINVYFRSRRIDGFTPDSAKVPFPFIPFVSIAAEFGKILAKWLDLHGALEPSFNLYFASKSSKNLYLHSQFLMLVQGLESLHRRIDTMTAMQPDAFIDVKQTLLDAVPTIARKWLEDKLKYANEPSLRQRMKSLLEGLEEFLGGNEACKKFISAVVDTRNYLTHFDPGLAQRASDGAELYELCLRLEVLFQLRIAELLGFSREQVRRYADASQSFHRKLIHARIKRAAS